MLKKVLLIFILFFFPIVSFATLPVSKEAVIIEVISSSEILMQGTGIYESNERSRRRRKKDVKKYGTNNAALDAKKAAIYYLLYNGSDPLLSTTEEMMRFSKIQNDIFSEKTINQLVVYASTTPEKTISLNNGEGIKVVMKLKINISFLRQLLEENLIIFSKQELVGELGYPQIIILPTATPEISSLERLTTDKQLQHAAGVIESYLTSKQYDVIIPSQLGEINELVNSIQNVKQINIDPSYQLALSIGSDIYLDYSVGESKGPMTQIKLQLHYAPMKPQPAGY